MPDQFEQLKQKYQPVLDKIQQEGAQLLNLNLDGNQLYLKAIAVSESSKNRIWDAIKAVDPTFADLKHDIEAKQGAQDYTVQPGDSLSGIAARLLGDQQRWPEVYSLNRQVRAADGAPASLVQPSLIWPGMQLRLPPHQPETAELTKK